MESLSPLRAFIGRFFLALLLAFSVTACSIGYAYWVANDRVDSANRVTVDLAEQEKGEPANFLIIGSDTREFVDDGSLDEEHFGDPTENTGQRSDTMMIAHVDPDTKSGFLVSIPRDLWVDIPELGEAKMNAAFNYGAQRVVDTIQSNFGVEIHHYIEVNFEGFRNLVDAVGKVPIYFPTPARDVQTGLYIYEAGCHELDGDMALNYVRSREYQAQDADGDWDVDGTADIGRMRRQQYFIRSLADEAVRATLRNPLKINDILNDAFDQLTFDDDLKFGDLRGLANAFREVDPAALEMVTLPTEPQRIDGQAALVLIESEAAPIFARLKEFGESETEVPSGVLPGDVSVVVLNGSGVGGQARAALDELIDAGFVGVEPPDNADNQDYAVTEVRYTAENEAKAQLVLASLGGAGELVAVDSLPTGSDIVLVLGSDYDGVTEVAITVPPEAAESTTPAAEAVTTTTAGPPPNPGGEGAFPVSGC